MVQAKNAFGLSEISSGLLMTTEEKPFSPDDIMLTDVGFNEVSKKLSWSAPIHDENMCVKVEKKQDDAEAWKVRYM